MGFKCGIIGLPNAGKSTIFNALTSGHAVCAPYPFTTLDPNVGIVHVPDERLNALAKIVPHDKVIPTTIEFADVPGLVEGASHGEGLGNQFLAKIMETDALVHVVRCFENPDIAHVAGAIGPVRDIEIIEHELIFKDIEALDKWISRNEKIAGSGDKKLSAALSIVETLREKMNNGLPARDIIDVQTSEILRQQTIQLLTLKPIFYVANIAEKDIKMPSGPVKEVMEHARKNNTQVVLMCGKLEEEMIQLEPADRESFMKDAGLKEFGLVELIKSGYKVLGLLTFFTTDSRQLRAWTVSKGTKAPQAAGKIHSDFEKGFIRAEVVSFKDFTGSGSEHSAKEKGLMRLEGKEYIVNDGDVIHFRFQA